MIREGSATWLLLAASLAVTACSRREPEGRRFDAPETVGLASLPTRNPVASASATTPLDDEARRAELEPGLGDRLASIAMRTWIYGEPRDGSRKLGYLRAGALVDRGHASAGTEGCEGGWYRVAPRGYACVGKGASLDLQHPIVQAAVRGPRRGEPTPYDYVVSDSPPPHLYFKLPTDGDQRRVEGSTVKVHVANRRRRFESVAADPVPPFLAEGNKLPTPYGSEKNLAYSVHRGRAPESSAFGLVALFDWTDRRFGLTTELDVIPLDRTKPATISALRGIALKEGGRPAFVRAGGTVGYTKTDAGVKKGGPIAGRAAFELTGESEGGPRGLLETTDGVWLAAEALVVGELRKDRANFAERGRKWISVSIDRQVLVAYEGDRPVYGALVSTGRGGLGDPAETYATIRGTFMIRSKHVSGTMDGDEGSDESFVLHDVPYIQYFHEGYALHAAYWHDDFGEVRSHGCVNLAPTDAAWLFEWTDPPVPKEWHGAVAPQGGTLVYVHR